MLQFTGADLSAVASNALQLALRRRVAEIEAQVKRRRRSREREMDSSDVHGGREPACFPLDHGERRSAASPALSRANLFRLPRAVCYLL